MRQLLQSLQQELSPPQVNNKTNTNHLFPLFFLHSLKHHIHYTTPITFTSLNIYYDITPLCCLMLLGGVQNAVIG
jgi:hypothetical protein